MIIICRGYYFEFKPKGIPESRIQLVLRSLIDSSRNTLGNGVVDGWIISVGLIPTQGNDSSCCSIQSGTGWKRFNLDKETPKIRINSSSDSVQCFFQLFYRQTVNKTEPQLLLINSVSKTFYLKSKLPGNKFFKTPPVLVQFEVQNFDCTAFLTEKKRSRTLSIGGSKKQKIEVSEKDSEEDSEKEFWEPQEIDKQPKFRNIHWSTTQISPVTFAKISPKALPLNLSIKMISNLFEN